MEVPTKRDVSLLAKRELMLYIKELDDWVQGLLFINANNRIYHTTRQAACISFVLKHMIEYRSNAIAYLYLEYREVYYSYEERSEYKAKPVSTREEKRNKRVYNGQKQRTDEVIKATIYGEIAKIDRNIEAIENSVAVGVINERDSNDLLAYRKAKGALIDRLYAEFGELY